VTDGRNWSNSVTGYGFEKRWKLVREEEQVVIIGVGG
jgi:hypothetical protein